MKSWTLKYNNLLPIISWKIVEYLRFCLFYNTLCSDSNSPFVRKHVVLINTPLYVFRQQTNSNTHLA